MSVQPTLGHHHKRIIRVTHSSLAAPLDQSVGLEEGVVVGVVSYDTFTASGCRTVDLLNVHSPSNIACINQAHYLPIPLVFGQDIKTS